MSHHRRIARVGLGAAAAVCFVVAATPAGAAGAAGSSPDRGLYGTQDPTYDGVYRQGLAITGLVAVGGTAPKRAVAWLTDQQCDNGSFLAYRADTAGSCPNADPANFAGPDTNSTALGAMALRAAGLPREADAAVRYLRRVQNPDGGFPFVKGGGSDANSTGLSLAAMRGARFTVGNSRAQKSAERFLRTVQLRCSAERSSRGLFSFQADPKAPNDLATVQATLGLLTTLPVASAELPDGAGPLRCADGKPTQKPNTAAAALAALKKRIKSNDGLLPSSVGKGTDPSATAQAVLAMAAADVYPRQVARAVQRLEGVADTFSGAEVTPVPGAVGTLLLVAAATDSDPRDFGGINLLRTLADSRR